MKFCVESQELNEALAVVTKALSPNVETPILKGIYISAFQNELYLKCSDSSIQIETLIPAMVDEDGSAVLPGRLTADLMRKTRGTKVNFETIDSSSMRVEAGKSKSLLQFFSAETYPQMDEVKGDASFNIKQGVFRSMIKQTAFCCAGEDEGKAILRGVLMEFTEEGCLNLVALDGFRLAKRTEKVSVNGERRNAVVPARTMQDIANILSDSDDEITVTLSSTHITVNMGTTKIKARLLKGEYINYRNILSKKSTSRVIVNRSELLESLEIASLFSKDSQNNLLKLDFENDLLTITARSETGSINETAEINLTGTPIEIAFNAKYLLDIVKAVDDEAIALSFNTSVTPCVAEPVQGEGFYYMVLPVRLMRS
ncbi:MAG: DNA polymerase III subunit beta [Clostridia bacterium]|nr:DNA polymerase III subunit beta [Clostridia bacterium]